jgi:DnaJ like chaperone protein
VRENHPDTLVARGVPKELVSIANEKLATINVAYEKIMRQRGA